MSYSSAANAAFRITGFAQGSNNYLGKIRTSFEKIINREVIQTDAVNTPEQRPVDNIDARITIEFLGWTSFLPETTSKADTVLTFSEVGGTTGSTLTYPNMLVSGYRAGIQRRNGGNPMAPDLEMVGSSFSETFAM